MATLKDSFLAPSKPQQTATIQSRTMCPASVIPGSAATSRQANPGADSGNPLGVGTVGDGRKPFRVGGG